MEIYTNINQENVHLPSFGGRESDNTGLVPYNISIQNIQY
jgi:hypothetical protein